MPVLDVRELTDGRVALPVYSSLERLISCCGHSQPWVPFRSAQLPELARGGGFEVVVLDAAVPPELRASAAGAARAVERDPRWQDPGSADWALVYLPSRPFRPGDEQARLELQPMRGGWLAVLAYSSLTLLAWGCGRGQSWVSVPAGLLDEARQQAGADTILLDTPLPPWLRHDADERG